MLGIFGLLFGTAAIVKDEFVEIDIDQRARESAYKSGRFYWVNTKGKYFTVEDNTPCYVAIRNGDRCVFRLKDGLILKNIDAEGRIKAEEEKNKKAEKARIEMYKKTKEEGEEAKRKAIESGNDLYMRSPYFTEHGSKYHFDITMDIYRCVKTGEYFVKKKNYLTKEDNFFPVRVSETVASDGKPYLGCDNTVSCAKYVFENNKYVIKRTNYDIKGLIIED